MHANTRYENFIVFLAPLVNSLGGIAIDLYAPSLPSIGRELGAGPALMQNTITITLGGVPGSTGSRSHRSCSLR